MWPSVRKRHRDEIKRARRRVRFRFVEAAIPLYERPCGCPNSNYLPDGIRCYQYSTLAPGVRFEDLCECFQCGAVWCWGDVQVDG